MFVNLLCVGVGDQTVGVHGSDEDFVHQNPVFDQLGRHVRHAPVDVAVLAFGFARCQLVAGEAHHAEVPFVFLDQPARLLLAALLMLLHGEEHAVAARKCVLSQTLDCGF